MPNETRISVPTRDVGWVTEALTRAGITVLDTGERVTTEEEIGGEAVLCLARLAQAEPVEVSISDGPMPE